MKNSAIRELLEALSEAVDKYGAPQEMPNLPELTLEACAELDANEARIRQEVIEECSEEAIDCLRVCNTDRERDLVHGVILRIRALSKKEAPCQSEK